MSEPAESDNELLVQARQLVECLQSDDSAAANQIIDALTGLRESEIYKELGKLTRELHEALSGFQFDNRISELAQMEMPSATERLSYVIKLTEESANTTLAAIEDTVPLSERMEVRGREIKDEWQRFKGRKMTINEFKTLSTKIESFLNDTTEDSALLQQKLNEVLMAQGFQDVTGQIIRHVINLVQEVEDNMVNLIRISGQEPKTLEPEAPPEDTALQGPVVPGVNDDEGTVSGQDEVDDLLSSLGF